MPIEALRIGDLLETLPRLAIASISAAS